ncbi:ferrous iron transport protein B [Streptomyces sp. 21So2-11]|uniref:ferrous iron transport protein B n=1 Tax=Streptomyces sp. 21So2-11 TaxID=3144408 RepID=UPI00321909A2
MVRTSGVRGAPQARRTPQSTASCCSPAQKKLPADGPTSFRIALVGNPNVGKSTLFNALTGARRRTGNWPGTTVEVASGSWSAAGTVMEVLDLPGTYSLTPRSPDEALVRDVLDHRADPQAPDLVVAVLDAANLARNLYLLAQVLDTGVRVVVALTMLDLARARGRTVDEEELSRVLGTPVVAVGSRSRDGLDPLATEIRRALHAPPPLPPRLSEPVEAAVEELISRLTAEPATCDHNVAGVPARRLALHLLTGSDSDPVKDTAPPPATTVTDALEHHLDRLRADIVAPGEPPGETGPDEDLDLETLLAEQRYAWVRRVMASCVRDAAESTRTLSDRLDRFATSTWLGMPLFLAVMWGVFTATTTLSAPLQGALTALFDGPVSDGVRHLLAAGRLDGTWCARFLLGGLIPGVGAVLAFVPLMAIMFVLLALLEGSGYLARAAFVADRMLRLIGLPGRAFLPLIVGFGCNVPAVAATRVLSDARHRLMTGLLVPFVTCSARLTVYLMLADVFFQRHAGTVVFAMYVLSIVLVVVVGLALRHTLFRHQPREAMILELPPYRLPTVRVVAAQSWQRLAGFLRTAAGIIVAATAAVWLLTAIPAQDGSFAEVPVSESLYGKAGEAVSVVFEPAGFGDWHATGALITGFVAKEAVVSTFAQSYSTDEPDDVRQAGDLGARLKETFDGASGGHPLPAVLAFMVFLLAYTPCVATVAAQRVEFGTRWAVLGTVGQLAIAYVLAVAVFQIGSLLS